MRTPRIPLTIGLVAGMLTMSAAIGIAATAPRVIGVPQDGPQVAFSGLETTVMSISAGDLHLSDDTSASIVRDINSGCIGTSADQYMHAGVNLPDGATVTNVRAHVFDDDAADAAIAYMYRLSASQVEGGSVPTSGVVATLGTSTDAGYQSLSAASNPGSSLIDNDTYVYTAEVVLEGDALACGFEITYIDPGASDEVLHSTAPCLIYDTREGKGGIEAPIGARATVTVDLESDDNSTQGGVSGSCGVPDEATAVQAVVHLQNATAGGSLKVGGDVLGDGPIMVFRAGDRTSVGTLWEAGTGGLSQLKNSSGGFTHVSVVVTGWYGPPA